MPEAKKDCEIIVEKSYGAKSFMPAIEIDNQVVKKCWGCIHGCKQERRFE